MYLELFIVFLLLSLVIVALGLFKPEHSELGLIGFLFLFLLSLVVLYGDIQYKVGENYTYDCLCCVDGRLGQTCDDNTSNLVKIASIDYYVTFESGGTFSHLVGYWLAVGSFIGFIGVLMGLRGNFRGD